MSSSLSGMSWKGTYLENMYWVEKILSTALVAASTPGSTVGSPLGIGAWKPGIETWQWLHGVPASAPESSEYRHLHTRHWLLDDSCHRVIAIYLYRVPAIGELLFSWFWVWLGMSGRVFMWSCRSGCYGKVSRLGPQAILHLSVRGTPIWGYVSCCRRERLYRKMLSVNQSINL